MGCGASKDTTVSVVKKLDPADPTKDKQAGSCFSKNGMPEAKLYVDEGDNYSIYQLFTACLAEMAYLIFSDGEAALIDPLREVEPYIDLLHCKGTKLKYIFETHFHADFVSGHYDMAKKTGA